MAQVVGQVFPRDAPRSRQSAAEVAVYKALRRALPEGWRAWHSLRLRRGSAWEGEGDFVIAAPDRGMLVLEVKGGRMELRDGRWTQNGKPLERSPRDQALGFVRNLADAVSARCGAWVPFGVACAFPDVDFDEGPQSGDLDGLVIGPRQLEWLEQALPGLMARAVPARALPADDRWLDVLHALWGDTWVPTVSLADEAAGGDARVVALADEQLRVLMAAEENPRAVVTGGAGTGKTMIAREVCLRATARGQRVLYLCFTDALGHAVERSFAEARAAGAQVRAVPIRRLAAELLSARGVSAPAGEAALWDGASLAACAALPAPDERPDLVVVDESQDLDDGDWALVGELAGPRGLWLLGDPRQTYWRRRPIPESLTSGAVRLGLQAQLRNPGPIAALAARYAAPAGLAADGLPALASSGPRIVRLVTTDAEHELDVLATELAGFVARGARPADLAVITLAGQSKSALLRRDTIADLPMVGADAPDAPGRLIGDTFLRFKGLERPFVFLVEVAAGHASQYERRMLIATTRATARLTILVTPEAAARDPRLIAPP